MDININKFLFKDVLTVKGVGKKLKKYLKKKNIEKLKTCYLIYLTGSLTDQKFLA